jgi:hypothetical protein
MKKQSELNEKYEEAGEEQLAALIKEAGEEVRVKRREAMANHFNRLGDIIRKATSPRQGSLSA